MDTHLNNLIDEQSNLLTKLGTIHRLNTKLKNKHNVKSKMLATEVDIINSDIRLLDIKIMAVLMTQENIKSKRKVMIKLRGSGLYRTIMDAKCEYCLITDVQCCSSHDIYANLDGTSTMHIVGTSVGSPVIMCNSESADIYIHAVMTGDYKNKSLIPITSEEDGDIRLKYFILI